MSSLDSGGPIEFLIPGSGDDYLDFTNTMLHVLAKVTRANGDDLDLADPVGPVNNWLHSLFSQVNVYLNGTLVTLLSYGPDAKNTQLTGQLWHKDTATRMDAVEIADGPVANEGFVARRTNIVRNRLDDMIGRLHVDLFLQDKFLINGVDVKIRLVHSKPAFALMAGGANPDCKINIVNATLFTTIDCALPAAFVCNTDDGDEPGEHWTNRANIALYLDADGRGDYFCSYGLPPRHAAFRTFLNEHCSEWTHNTKRLQNPITNVCGKYCVAFVLLRSIGIPMRTFVNIFGTDLAANDCRVFD